MGSSEHPLRFTKPIWDAPKVWLSPGGPFSEERRHYFECASASSPNPPPFRVWDTGDWVVYCFSSKLWIHVRRPDDGTSIPGYLDVFVHWTDDPTGSEVIPAPLQLEQEDGTLHEIDFVFRDQKPDLYTNPLDEDFEDFYVFRTFNARLRRGG